MTITPEELQILCDTTVNLVELRQRNCPHLSVETVAPEIMRDLFAALLRAKESGARDAVGSPIDLRRACSVSGRQDGASGRDGRSSREPPSF